MNSAKFDGKEVTVFQPPFCKCRQKSLVVIETKQNKFKSIISDVKSIQLCPEHHKMRRVTGKVRVFFTVISF